MRNMLAIAVLMVGMVTPVLAQNYSPDAPLTADTPSTDNKDNNKEQEEQKQDAPKYDCTTDKQSSAPQNAPCPDCENAQSPDQAPQNVIEYGG